MRSFAVIVFAAVLTLSAFAQQADSSNAPPQLQLRPAR